jgi:hypothetical protein
MSKKPFTAEELEKYRPQMEDVVPFADRLFLTMDAKDKRIAEQQEYISEMEATHIRDHDHIGQLLEEQRADRKRIKELGEDLEKAQKALLNEKYANSENITKVKELEARLEKEAEERERIRSTKRAAIESAYVRGKGASEELSTSRGECAWAYDEHNAIWTASCGGAFSEADGYTARFCADCGRRVHREGQVEQASTRKSHD